MLCRLFHLAAGKSSYWYMGGEDRDGSSRCCVLENLVFRRLHAILIGAGLDVQSSINVFVGSPMKSRRYSAIRCAMTATSLPRLVVRSSFTTAVRPSRHFFSSSGPFAGILRVPISLNRSLSDQPPQVSMAQQSWIGCSVYDDRVGAKKV